MSYTDLCHSFMPPSSLHMRNGGGTRRAMMPGPLVLIGNENVVETNGSQWYLGRSVHDAFAKDPRI